MRTTLLAAAIAAFVLPIAGQTLGEISGRVSDPSGAGVPGTSLTLTNTSTNAIRQAISGDDGFYDFPSVPPGIYNLKTEHAGFKAANSSNVEVQVQQSVRLDYTLEVGQVTESVQVQATAELLQADDATVGTVIQTDSITQLPLNGREYLNLVALTSNADTLAPAAGQAQSRQGGDRSNQAISAGGNRIFFDYFTLDGVNNTDVDFNTYIALPSIDAIQEFKVQTGVYPAEFGHGATQINVVTKSGGNAFHGSLFEFVRNDSFDAIPYAFTTVHPVKSPFKWNDYGFEVDGPIYIPKIYNGRNRLFFMANDEWLTQRQHTLSTYSLPTAAMEQGNFSAYPATIYQPGSGGIAFPNNIIPPTMLNPISLELLKFYGASTLPGFQNNYTQFTSSPFNRDGFVLRMDFIESAKSQWTGRYSWGSELQQTGGLNITGSKVTTGYEQYLGSNTRTFKPNLINEARFGYSRFYNAISPLSAFVTNIVGSMNPAIPNLVPGPPVQWGVPPESFSGDGFTAIGDNSDYPYQNSNNTTQFVDTASWIKGKHTLRFGFEYNRQNFDQEGNQYLRGGFTFSPNATQNPNTKSGGDAFAEYLLGYIFQSTTALQIADANFQRNVEHAFIDDTWKITPRLTLSAGLRYELTPPFTDTIGNLFSIAIPHIYGVSDAPVSQEPYFIRQGNCSNPYTANPPIPFTWVVTPAVCSNGLENYQLNKTRYDDFAPRLSIAYSPDSKTVIRAGYGIFFVQDNANSMYFDLARNIGVRFTASAMTDGDVWGPSSGALTGLPATWQNAVTPPGAGFGAPYGYVTAYEHHTSYTEQYLLNIQRQVGPNWVFEAGYLGSESHHLYGFQNANDGIPGTVGTAASRLPWPDFGFIQLVDDGMNALYNSLAFKVTKRFSQGLSLISSYTFSKSIDDSSGIRVQGYDTLFPQNSYCIRCERGLSAFDVRNRWVTSALYELPVGRGKLLNINNRFANGVIGGWQTGGLVTVQSGVPATLSIGGVDNSETTAGYDRPSATGAPLYVSNQSPAQWFNPAAFVEAPPGTYGNVGRDTMIVPGTFIVNAEVHKEFRMPHLENHRLQFRLETFNTLNHPNWGEPNVNILAGAATPGQPSTYPHQNFGVITTTAQTMRQLQLGLKYTF
ncbi:MAG TPA: carboxypeptidase regulatory-like domain-containing protein [Bryobacteraceae bacterium]